MEEKIKVEVIRLLEEENPGLLRDEADHEADRIMYRINMYEQAKWNLLTPHK